MIIAGLDYSVNSPGICVGTDESTKFEDFQFYSVSDSDKKCGDLASNVHVLKKRKDFANQQERYRQLANLTVTILEKESVNVVCMEGLSARSMGPATTSIVMNQAILREVLWQHGFKTLLVPPNQLKKFYTGKGNAKKDLMCMELIKRLGPNLHDAFNAKKVDAKPLDDLCDAHALFSFYITNHTFGEDSFNGC